MLILIMKFGVQGESIFMNEGTNKIFKDRIIGNNIILVDRFPFCRISKVSGIYDTIFIKHPQNAKDGHQDLLPTANSIPSIEEYVDFINVHKIEKAKIIADDINFLIRCPTLKFLNISPSNKSIANFDYSPLYQMPEIKKLGCKTVYGEGDKFSTSIDYSRIRGLEFLHIGKNDGFSCEKIKTLKTLVSREYQGTDLNGLVGSPVLDTLKVSVSKIKSVNGIKQSPKMQCLYLFYNYSLSNIEALYDVKDTLRSLCIDHSPKIKDFSVLRELKNLERLMLIGSNSLPNLNFIKELKNLSTFIFSMKIEDGDLTPCLSLPYVYCSKNYKHYNLKDKQLPKEKSRYSRGNENIDAYRRLM